MNIFILDTNIDQNVKMHCDKHVVKMIVEYCQLLSTACHVHGTATPDMYRKTHVNHPCGKWVQQSRQNFEYLLDLTIALMGEYTYRYGKVHASTRLIPLFIDAMDSIPQGQNKLTPFAIVVNNEDRLNSDVVSEYRHLYSSTKKEMCTWKNREIPTWWIGETA